MFTKIHQKCPRKFTPKMSMIIHQKCPREFTHFVHENSPFMSTRSLPPGWQELNFSSSPNPSKLRKRKENSKTLPSIVSKTSNWDQMWPGFCNKMLSVSQILSPLFLTFCRSKICGFWNELLVPFSFNFNNCAAPSLHNIILVGFSSLFLPKKNYLEKQS